MQNGYDEVSKGDSFMDKMDCAAREVSKSGPRPPNWAVAFHWLKSVLQNIVIGIIFYYLPSTDVDSRDRLWHTLVRYTAWTHLMDSLALRQGPMYGRYSPGPLGVFSNTYYWLTPGTLRFSLLREGYEKRTVFNVLCHILHSVALVSIAVFPDAPYVAFIISAVGTQYLFLFDNAMWTVSHGPTYGYILAAGCLPASSGSFACAQFHVLLVWIGSGWCKIGPWFRFVNGPFMTASVCLRGREWFWRLAVNGKDDLRPTFLMGTISSLAAHVEWVGPLCFLTKVPIVVYLGLFALISMHLYINCAPAIVDVYPWNWWFIAISPMMFCGLSMGVDYDALAIAPRWLILWLCLEFAYIWYGLMLPEKSTYQGNFRNWNGNWPNGVVMIRKTAADRLLEPWSIPGRPHWSPPPAWVQSLLGKLGQGAQDYETRMFKIMGNYWNVSLNMKFMPALVQRALQGQSISDFYVLHVNTFSDVILGAQTWSHRMPELLMKIGEQSQVEKGDCVCIWMGAFPFRFGLFRGSHPWKMVDVKAGVLEEGEVTMERAWNISGLPSDGQRAENMLLGA